MIRKLLKNTLPGEVFVTVSNLIENKNQYKNIDLEELAFFIKLYNDENTDMVHVLGLNGIPYLFSKEADIISFSFDNPYFNLAVVFQGVEDKFKDNLNNLMETKEEFK